MVLYERMTDLVNMLHGGIIFHRLAVCQEYARPGFGDGAGRDIKIKIPGGKQPIDVLSYKGYLLLFSGWRASFEGLGGAPGSRVNLSTQPRWGLVLIEVDRCIGTRLV